MTDELTLGMMSNCGDDPGTGLDNYLFNVVDDPNETTNHYLNASHASVVNQMMATLKGHMQREVMAGWLPPVTYPYTVWAEAGGVIVPWQMGR